MTLPAGLPVERIVSGRGAWPVAVIASFVIVAIVVACAIFG